VSDSPRPEPYVREMGSGPAVACLHANASTSGQWHELMELLSPRFYVVAPDLYGSGRSPSWPSKRVIRLKDEAALIAPALARAGAPLALVGHSYGAALALIVALANPGRIRALILFEPILLSLLDPRMTFADGEDIRPMLSDAAAALDAGNANAAAERFIDYWLGNGAFRAMPESRQAPIAASVMNLRRWVFAVTTEPTPLTALRTLDVPVLCMHGARTRAPARSVTRLIASALPRAELVEMDGIGHMGPVTHPARVNEAIARFLVRHHVEREAPQEERRALRFA